MFMWFLRRKESTFIDYDAFEHKEYYQKWKKFKINDEEKKYCKQNKSFSSIRRKYPLSFFEMKNVFLLQ